MMRRPLWLVVLLAAIVVPSAAAQPATPDTAKRATPVELGIDRIGVLARCERVEIDRGVMQPPTNLAVAGWYGGFDRLGGSGNVVLTGYYYWSGLPALLYDLALLTQGDSITLVGDDEQNYDYLVESVTTHEKSDVPINDILRSDRREMLTIITDAGNADALGEFTRATIVRAERV